MVHMFHLIRSSLISFILDTVDGGKANVNAQMACISDLTNTVLFAFYLSENVIKD